MEVITLMQGDEMSDLTPLFLVHAISGVALPFLRLDSLSDEDERPVYGITSPLHCPGGDSFKYPTSLKDLAAYYLQGIREIQPEGPYLLGGWSMGGMISMFMAQMLEAQGEEVIKVIMIDSANPEVFPQFKSAQEHLALAKATFDRTVSGGGLESDDDEGSEFGSTVSSPIGHTFAAGDYHLSYSRRSSTWNSASSSTVSSARSSAASIFDTNSPITSPESPLSDAYLTDDSEFDSDCDSEFDEPPAMEDFMQQIKTHIRRGLGLISNVKPGDLFEPGKKSNFDAILIKCTTEIACSVRKPEIFPGAQLIEIVMRERNMRWDPSQFRSFESIPFSGDHDGAFQPQYVEELSSILRECIEDVE